MANEKHKFFCVIPRVFIPALDLVQPAKIFGFPVGISALKGTPRASAGNEHVKFHIGYFVSEPHIKFSALDDDTLFLPKLLKNIPQASHALVRLSFIKIKDRNFQFLCIIHTDKHNAISSHKFYAATVFINTRE
jgi:hypothetical protein